MNRVISCDRHKPPMITKPRKRRASALAPMPRATGGGPKIAATILLGNTDHADGSIGNESEVAFWSDDF